MDHKSQNIQDYNFPLKPGSNNYLDMVPDQSITRIRKMAHKAFAERGNERSLQEYTEDMAKFWLMIREEFCSIVKAHGFTQVNLLDVDEKKAVFLFTETGSFLAGTSPNKEGERDFVYQKAHLLGDQVDAHCGYGKLSARSYPKGLVERKKILANCTMYAEVKDYIETTPVSGIYVGKADFDKLKMLGQLIKATIIDAGYFTQTG